MCRSRHEKGQGTWFRAQGIKKSLHPEPFAVHHKLQFLNEPCQYMMIL